SNPKQTKAIAAARLKNDRVDAERLALLLRGDLLPTVWIPPAELREARELVRHRVSLVWVRTEIKNRLLALLRRRNLQPTSSKRWLTVRGRRELEGLPLGAIPSTVREDCLALLRVLDERIRRPGHARGARSRSAAPPDHSWSRPLHGHPPDPRARGDPALPERQAPRQLRGPDAPRPGQRQSRADGPHQQRRQSTPPLGPRRRRHASGAPARPPTRLVPGRPAEVSTQDRPRGPGPTLGGDRLSDLEARPGLRHAGPRWRAEVSPVR